MAVALVTGSAGFVGRQLVPLLTSHGYDVVGVDRAGTPAIDLLDRVALARVISERQPTHVFHLGGLLRAPDYAALYEANVIATAHLLEALKPPVRVVVASSSAVYGTAAADVRIDESRVPAPLTHYAASKLAQEAVALQAFHARALHVVITRSFNVVGPGQPASLAAGAFAEQLARAERSPQPTFETGDLTALRDFIDVRDVATGMLAAVERGTAGQIYNLCSGVARPVSDCVDALVRAVKVKIARTEVAQRSHTQALTAQVGSPDKLKQTTGWKPAIPFEQSMNDLLDSWRLKVAEENGSVRT
jgi:GDP-4-dehydro-6-deoxy-D-mannose reductase